MCEKTFIFFGDFDPLGEDEDEDAVTAVEVVFADILLMIVVVIYCIDYSYYY